MEVLPDPSAFGVSGVLGAAQECDGQECDGQECDGPECDGRLPSRRPPADGDGDLLLPQPARNLPASRRERLADDPEILAQVLIKLLNLS